MPHLLRKNKSFLIVDDNSVMRRTIRRVIGEFANKIIECDDGAKAFAAYELHHPDWVLMDVEMPEMDGLTAMREICATYREAKIVIVTKHGDAEMREAARLAGAFGFVVKENLLELRGIIANRID
jgi:two-component system, chemotaxis family, chemotaxis protein CheY